jgi:Dyp-type peroxidase family
MSKYERWYPHPDTDGDDAAPDLELDDVQRLVVYGLGERPESLYLFLQVTDAATAKAWLREQLPVADGRRHGVLVATRKWPESETVGLALGFTYLGLTKLGLHKDALETFAPEFRQGITAGHRARVLGDVGKNASESWIWGQWSGEDSGAKDPKQVHVLCAVYARGEDELAAWRATWSPGAAGFRVVQSIRATQSKTEPFGFRDGISQPHIKGSGRAVEGVAARDQIEAGEFVFGYPNEFGRYTESPRVARELDPGGVLRDTVDGRSRDLGRNGTYFVVRELEQDVDAFRKLPLYERVSAFGRWENGAPLVLHPVPLGARAQAAPAPVDDEYRPENDFTYAPEDAAGLRCPLGAHVRRANPRDALASPETGTSPEQAIELVNTHRILRRSRRFGPKVGSPEEARGYEGTLFQCINTNIERQFEFVQQTWVNNVKFSGPFEERDPVVGAGPMDRTGLTLKAAPERERVEGLAPFITVRGGAYFFLPGVRALVYLTAP